MAIGQKLEEARNRKGISIREASESTKIRGDFLTSFEAGKFDLQLPEVYLAWIYSGLCTIFRHRS